ncbi:MAG TPA: FecR domain-containing protein [Candidatus Binatia bacterium]|nr:FecR domain-containing protein [Candidatus Binatia bacterium]
MIGRRIRALALLLLLITPAVAAAQVVKAGIVTTAEGHVTARRVVLPQPVPLKFKDDVFLQDTITTGDRSLARLLLAGKAVVTVRERSTLTITEVPGRSTVEIAAGKIGMAVARDRMRPGEAIDIRTPNAIVAVRGTVLVVEVRRATAQAGGGGGAPVTDVYLLRDHAEVSALDPGTGAPIGPPLPLQSGQRFTVVGTAPPQVTSFTAADEAHIVEGLQARSVPHQEAANQEEVKGMLLATTATLLAAVTGTGPERLALAPGEETTGPASTEPAPATPTAPPIIPEIAPALEESAVPPREPTPTPPPSTGVEIFVTGDVTIPAGQTLRTFSGTFSRMETSPLIQVSNARLSQQGPDDLIEVLGGASVDLASLLLDIRDSAVRAGRSLLRVNGFLSGSNPNGLIAADPSTLASAGDLIRVDPGGGIFTVGPLLSALDARIVTAPGQLLHVLGDPVSEGHGFVVTSGTLLSFTRSDLDLADNLVRLVDGGVLAQFAPDEAPSAAPLVVFRDSTYRGGLGSATVTGGSLLRMFSQQGALAGSALLLTGPFLDAVGSRFKGREAPLFNIADGALIFSLSARPFASFERSVVVSASGFFNVETGSGDSVFVTLAGSLVRAVDTTFQIGGAFLRLHDAVSVTQTGPVSLLDLRGGGITAVDALIAIQNGAALVVGESTSPLAAMVGGNHSIATNPGTAMLRLAGRPDAVATQTITLPELQTSMNLVLGTDRPISGISSGVFGRPLAEVSGATINTQSVLRIDTALLEATLPALGLKSGSTLTSTTDAFDLAGRANIKSLGPEPLVALDASILSVNHGALIRLANGSVLDVAGDLLSLSNGSRLNLSSGAVLNVTGNSVVVIGGAFVAFRGSGNQINITNNACSANGCLVFGPEGRQVRVALTGGATRANVSIGDNVVKDTGGVIDYSSPSAAAIVVDGTSRVVIRGR